MAGGGNNSSNDANSLTFGSLAICGISSSCIVFATGLACLIVALIRMFDSRFEDGKQDCGQDGHPPLGHWVFGAGVGYLIIACAFCRVSRGKAGNCAKLILAVSNLFIMIWAIVGSYSLWQRGTDCKIVDPTLWRMGYAAVVLSFLVCCCGGFVGYKQVTIPEAEAVVVEDIEEAVPASSVQQSTATAVPIASQVTEVADA